ncbi:MAG: hypothetical protein R3F20_07655 [Planctomycetota bacterium]
MLRFAPRFPLALALVALVTLSAGCGGGGRSGGGGSPALLAVFPLSGAEIFGDTVIVQGRVTPGVAAIRIEGTDVPVSPVDGSFAHPLSLVPGRNPVKLAFVRADGTSTGPAAEIVIHRAEIDVLSPEAVLVSPAGDRAWYVDLLPEPQLIEIDLETESRTPLGGPLPVTGLTSLFVNFPPPRTLLLDAPRNRLLVVGDGLVTVDLATGEQTTIIPPPVQLTNTFRVVHAAPSPDPDLVWLGGLVGPIGQVHLAPLDLTTDTVGTVLPPGPEAPSYFISGMALDAAGARILALDFDRVVAFDLATEEWSTASDLADGPSTDARRGFAFDPVSGRVLIADRFAEPSGPALRLRSFPPDDPTTIEERRIVVSGTTLPSRRIAVTADAAHGGFSFFGRGALLNVSASDLGTLATLAFPARPDVAPLPERMFRDEARGEVLTLAQAPSGEARLVALGDRSLAPRPIATGMTDLFKPIQFDAARRRILGLSTNDGGTIAVTEIDVDGGASALVTPVPGVFLGAPGAFPLPGSAPSVASPLPLGIEAPPFGIVGVARDAGGDDLHVLYSDGARLRLDHLTLTWQIEAAAIVFPGFEAARPTEDGRVLYAWSITNPDDGGVKLRMIALDIATGASEFLSESAFAAGEEFVPTGSPVLLPTRDAVLLLGVPATDPTPTLYRISIPEGEVTAVVSAVDDPFGALAGAIELVAESERFATLGYRRTEDATARPGLVQISIDTGEIARVLR